MLGWLLIVLVDKRGIILSEFLGSYLELISKMEGFKLNISILIGFSHF